MFSCRAHLIDVFKGWPQLLLIMTQCFLSLSLFWFSYLFLAAAVPLIIISLKKKDFFLQHLSSEQLMRRGQHVFRNLTSKEQWRFLLRNATQTIILFLSGPQCFSSPQKCVLLMPSKSLSTGMALPRLGGRKEMGTIWISFQTSWRQWKYLISVVCRAGPAVAKWALPCSQLLSWKISPIAYRERNIKRCPSNKIPNSAWPGAGQQRPSVPVERNNRALSISDTQEQPGLCTKPLLFMIID